MRATDMEIGSPHGDLKLSCFYEISIELMQVPGRVIAEISVRSGGCLLL